MRRFLCAAAVMALAIAAPGAGRAAGGLPSVDQGPRPGPAILYEPLATAPQLENANGWEAEPLMVSGADAYAGGEYLYQDWVYDSYGANTTNDLLAQPDTVPASGDTLFGGATGDVVYPTDASRYAFDAADLLEFRARPVPGGVAYRITLNTMIEPDLAGVAIGIDSCSACDSPEREWGYGIGDLGALGLDHVLVTWGTGATFDGQPIDSAADTHTNQIEVVAPIEPGDATWRHYLVVGLFDADAGTFAKILDEPTDTSPGGAHGTDAPPVLNVGFRSGDPDSAAFEPVLGTVETTDRQIGARDVGAGHFREHHQALALAARNISQFGAGIDFGKLEAGVDESHVPSSGYLNRLYVSHLNLGEGAQPNRPMLLGRIQPYSLFVPEGNDPDVPAPFYLSMHSLSCSYNQYAVFAPNQLTQLGQERGALVMTPEGRGPDGWYHDEAEYDVFEAWADVAARYAIDWEHVTLGGYSMGGFGTYRMASLYPDLFGAGFSTVGPADESILGGPTGGDIEDDYNNLRIAENLRNVPLLMWHGANDELVPVAGALRYEDRLFELGYVHETRVYAGYDHFLFSIMDLWGDGKRWLDASTVDRDPAHVTYRAMPEMDNTTAYPAAPLVHDRAYWVSDIGVVDGARSALVDVRSEVTGEGDPATTSLVGQAALVNGDTAPGTWFRRGVVSVAPTTVTPRNALVVSLTGVASVTFWVERAGIDAEEPIHLSVDSTAAATITLAGDGWSADVGVPAGHSEITFIED